MVLKVRCVIPDFSKFSQNRGGLEEFKRHELCGGAVPLRHHLFPRNLFLA